MDDAVKNELPAVTYYRGRPLAEMSKEELIEIIQWQERRYWAEATKQNERTSRWMKTAFVLAKSA